MEVGREDSVCCESNSASRLYVSLASQQTGLQHVVVCNLASGRD
jgi:hypothetical protein